MHKHDKVGLQWLECRLVEMNNVFIHNSFALLLCFLHLLLLVKTIIILVYDQN